MGDPQWSRMWDAMAIETTEHAAETTEETIYLTRFGGFDGSYEGSCNYDPTSFLADLNPADDFAMDDTARVKWTTTNNKQAVGLNFHRSAN